MGADASALTQSCIRKVLYMRIAPGKGGKCAEAKHEERAKIKEGWKNARGHRGNYDCKKGGEEDPHFIKKEGETFLFQSHNIC